MEPLELEAVELFSYEAVSESPPILALESAIRLGARKTSCLDDELHTELLAAYRFPRYIWRQFERLKNALVLIVEDAEAQRACAMALIDPHKRYPPLPHPNFKGPVRAPISRQQSFKTGWVRAPVRFGFMPSDVPPSIFARIVLHNWVSNPLAFDAEKEAISSPGYEALISEEGFEEETDTSLPSLVDEPTLTLTADPEKAAVVRWKMRIPEASVEAIGGMERWLRSLFITVIERGYIVSQITSVFESDLLFADDWRTLDGPSGPVVQASGAVDLKARFEGLPASRIYHVHVSARGYVSPILELTWT